MLSLLLCWCAEQMLTQAPLAYGSGGSLSVASVANAVFDSASADAVDELLNKALYLFTPKQIQKALALVDQASSLSVFACVPSAHGCVRQGGVTCVVAEASRRTLCQVRCEAPLLRRSPPHARSGQRPQDWRGIHLLPWPFLQLPRLSIRRRLQGRSTKRAFAIAKGWPLLTVLRSASTCWPRSSRVRWSGAAWGWERT